METRPPPPPPIASETTVREPRSILKRLNERFQRLTPLLLMVAVGLLLVSVILQTIICVAVLRGVPAEITNRGRRGLRGQGVPVEIMNSEVSVEITNREVPVKLENHYIIDADPIPVTIVR